MGLYLSFSWLFGFIRNFPLFFHPPTLHTWTFQHLMFPFSALSLPIFNYLPPLMGPLQWLPLITWIPPVAQQVSRLGSTCTDNMRYMYGQYALHVRTICIICSSASAGLHEYHLFQGLRVFPCDCNFHYPIFSRAEYYSILYTCYVCLLHSPLNGLTNWFIPGACEWDWSNS